MLTLRSSHAARRLASRPWTLSHPHLASLEAGRTEAEGDESTAQARILHGGPTPTFPGSVRPTTGLCQWKMKGHHLRGLAPSVIGNRRRHHSPSLVLTMVHQSSLLIESLLTMTLTANMVLGTTMGLLLAMGILQ